MDSSGTHRTWVLGYKDFAWARWAGVIAVLALLLGACAGGEGEHGNARTTLARAVPAASGHPSDEVVARVNGRALGRTDFAAFWITHPQLGRPEALRAFIEQEVLVQAGLARPSGAEEDAALGFARKQAMVERLLLAEIEEALGEGDLAEDEVARKRESIEAFAREPAGYRVSHIVVGVPMVRPGPSGESVPIAPEERAPLLARSQAIATQMRRSLPEVVSRELLERTRAQWATRVEPPFFVHADLGLQFPWPPLAENAGTPLPEGWLTVVEPFARASAALAHRAPPLTLSEPVASDYGWHLLVVEEVLEARAASPADVLALARFEALREARAALFVDKLTRWVEGATLYMFPENLAEARASAPSTDGAPGGPQAAASQP